MAILNEESVINVFAQFRGSRNRTQSAHRNSKNLLYLRRSKQTYGSRKIDTEIFTHFSQTLLIEADKAMIVKEFSFSTCGLKEIDLNRCWMAFLFSFLFTSLLKRDIELAFSFYCTRSNSGAGKVSISLSRLRTLLLSFRRFSVSTPSEVISIACHKIAQSKGIHQRNRKHIAAHWHISKKHGKSIIFGTVDWSPSNCLSLLRTAASKQLRR